MNTLHVKNVTVSVFSPNGTLLATVSADNAIKVWDLASGSEVRTFHSRDVSSLAFSPDGARLACGSWDAIKVWDVASGSELHTLSGHVNRVTCLAFNADGTRLASGSHAIKLWDVGSGSELLTLVDPNVYADGSFRYVQSVAFSPDGSRLVTANGDGTIKLWEAASDSEYRILTGHTNRVNSVAFSRDGMRLYSAHLDRGFAGEQIVWETNSGKRLSATEWKEPIKDQRLSPNGRWLAAPSYKDVLFVDHRIATTKRLTREKTWQEITPFLDRVGADSRWIIVMTCQCVIDVNHLAGDAEKGNRWQQELKWLIEQIESER